MNLYDILSAGLQAKASDIHLKAGIPPVYRIDGALRPLGKMPRMTPEATLKIAIEIMNEGQREHF